MVDSIKIQSKYKMVESPVHDGGRSKQKYWSVCDYETGKVVEFPLYFSDQVMNALQYSQRQQAIIPSLLKTLDEFKFQIFGHPEWDFFFHLSDDSFVDAKCCFSKQVDRIMGIIVAMARSRTKFRVGKKAYGMRLIIDPRQLNWEVETDPDRKKQKAFYKLGKRCRLEDETWAPNCIYTGYTFTIRKSVLMNLEGPAMVFAHAAVTVQNNQFVLHLHIHRAGIPFQVMPAEFFELADSESESSSSSDDEASDSCSSETDEGFAALTPPWKKQC